MVFSLADTIAQNNFPTAYEIKTDTIVNITLDVAYWQMLEDREREWTIDDVSRPPIASANENTVKEHINKIYFILYLC